MSTIGVTTSQWDGANFLVTILSGISTSSTGHCNIMGYPHTRCSSSDVLALATLIIKQTLFVSLTGTEICYLTSHLEGEALFKVDKTVRHKNCPNWQTTRVVIFTLLLV